MTITHTSIAEGVWVVRADGRLDQNAIPDLEQTLNALLDDGVAGIIVDLSQASYINSGGLRCLVSAWRRAQRQESTIVLCGLNARLLEIFTMVGFDRVFQILETCAEARQRHFR